MRVRVGVRIRARVMVRVRVRKGLGVGLGSVVSGRVRLRVLTGAISKTRPMSEAMAICLYSCGDCARHAFCPK